MCGVSGSDSTTSSGSRDVPASGPASSANGSSSVAGDMPGRASAMKSQPFRSPRGHPGGSPRLVSTQPGPLAFLRSYALPAQARCCGRVAVMDGSSAVSGTPEPDDLGFPVPFPEVVHRVVSLVPSLTEAIAATAPRLLV